MTGGSMRPYLMLAPALLLMFVFFIYPIFYMGYLSLTDWDFISPDKQLIGLGNYGHLFQDELFRQVLANSFVYTFVSVTAKLVIALGLALWLNRSGLWAGAVQGAIFSPYIISMVTVSMLWMWIMEPNYGLLNGLMQVLGLPRLKWLDDPATSMASLILIAVWKQAGFYTLILLAGLQSIPGDMYEAADLDRTPWWRRFFRLTLPMLSPTIFFLVIVGMISSFQVFETIFITTEGGPLNSTNTLVYFIYQNGFLYFKIGYASAAGVILFVIIAVLTFVYFKFLERKVHYR